MHLEIMVLEDAVMKTSFSHKHLSRWCQGKLYQPVVYYGPQLHVPEFLSSMEVVIPIDFKVPNLELLL